MFNDGYNKLDHFADFLVNMQELTQRHLTTDTPKDIKTIVSLWDP